MRALALEAAQAAGRPGLVLCHNVFDPERPKRIVLRKGRTLVAEDRDVLQLLDKTELHLLELEPDDVDEDSAGERLAAAACGRGASPAGSAESQVRIEATVRGLLKVDSTRLARVNAEDGVTVWTLENLTPVEAGRHVASAKIAPLAIERSALERAESAAGDGVISVATYRDRATGVIVTEHMPVVARDRFERGLRGKIEWFGATTPSVTYPAPDAGAAAAALEAAESLGTELVLVGGTGSTDPLDPMFEAVRMAGGKVLRRGVPAHPGSTYWLASVRDMRVLGLASCGMFSQTTALDLLLPRFFAGETLDAASLTSLAVGGLIGKDRAYLFPQYGSADRD